MKRNITDPLKSPNIEAKNVEGCRDGSAKKPQKLGIGMAVCRQDRVNKDYTSNPIPTFLLGIFMLSFCRLHYEMSENSIDGGEKECRDGGTCVVFVCNILPAHCRPYT